MGLRDTITGMFGGDDGEENEQAEDEAEEPEPEEVFEEEIEEDIDDEWDEDGEWEEEDEPTWDNAYHFAEEWLEEEGFPTMNNFATKVMMYEVERDPQHRDRFDNGIDTINDVAEAKRALEEISGDNDGGDESLQEKAEKVQAANELIDSVEKMEGKEEQYVQEALRLGRDAVEGLTGNSGGSSTENVNTGTRQVDKEL